jgi:hypothetical protein
MQPAASRPTRAVCKTVLEGQLRNVLFMHEVSDALTVRRLQISMQHTSAVYVLERAQYLV